jgi:hypothetical protein
MDKVYRWRRPRPSKLRVRYRIGLLLLLAGAGLEIGGVLSRDVWFAFSGLVVIALGALLVIKTAWRATEG